MTEAFLHYIWQHQLFDKANLRTDEGQNVVVKSPGTYNTNAGPDFFDARVKLDETLWAGNVEIHLRTSDWIRHNHHIDTAYDNCILHVVYENDAVTLRTDGSRIPVFELKNKFPSFLWENYLKLINKSGWVVCSDRIHEADEQTWKNANNHLIRERLEKRMQQILFGLTEIENDWNESFYRALSKNFGFKVNAIPFELLARSLPFRIISLERTDPMAIEALLLGQAGMLEGNFMDTYPNQLKELYLNLKGKYSLRNISSSSWKFSRLRPVNFPTIRLAQLSKVLLQERNLFERLLESENLKNIFSQLNVKASEYWNTHYRFDEISSYVEKKLGNESINNILINTFIPFLYSWGSQRGERKKVDRALSFLQNIPVENNFIIRNWKNLGVKANNAEMSQSLLQLKHDYCERKRCLECSIGKYLIQSTTKNKQLTANN